MSVQRLLVYALLSMGTKVARTSQEPTPAFATVATKAMDRHVRTSMNVKSTSAAHLLIVQTCQDLFVVPVLKDLQEMACHAWTLMSVIERTTVTPMQYVPIC